MNSKMISVFSKTNYFHINHLNRNKQNNSIFPSSDMHNKTLGL